MREGLPEQPCDHPPKLHRYSYDIFLFRFVHLMKGRRERDLCSLARLGLNFQTPAKIRQAFTDIKQPKTAVREHMSIYPSNVESFTVVLHKCNHIFSFSL